MNRSNCLFKIGSNLVAQQPLRTLRTSNHLLQNHDTNDFDLPPYVHQKLSYAYGRSSKPFSIETLPQILEKRAAEDGSRVLFTLHHEEKTLTYAMLREQASRLASILHHKIGIAKGDMIGLWSLNTANWIIVKLAADFLGAVLVTINPYYKVDELAYLVQKSQCKILFMPGEESVQLSYNNFTEVVQDESFLQQVSQTKLGHFFLIDGVRKQSKYGKYPVHTFEDFPVSQSYPPIDFYQDPDDPSCLMFTSGTTGKPKGALLSSFSMLNDCDFASDRLGLHDDTVKICCPLPFFHSYAFTHGLYTSLVRNHPVVVTDYKFDVRSVSESIKKYECTVFLSTPTMVIDLMAYIGSKGISLDSLSTLCLGGAVLDPDIVRQIKTKIPSVTTVLNGYGSTELSPATTLCSWNDDPEKIKSTVGRPLPYVEVKIVDPKTTKIMPHHEKGEIWVRGFNVMQKYFDDEEKTRESITSGGWYQTGDIGIMDEAGYLKIAGRIKEMLIRGGENIYPQEVENALMSHPAIKEAYVFGIPDERVGEEICTWISLDQNEPEVAPKEVREFLKGKLTYFKIPKHVFIVKEFPKLSTIKVSKLEMKKQTIEMLKDSNKS
ncbi:acyl-CoA synthetase family member 2, mitochondrial [Tetranychus urticae]|uniref:acyl-CoA synthetase family member 2, mitochondrial n=1 Tax=Tetranychus urticae TaxID=32264 RepID=UPI00077BEFBD|nr:acyl-CoA synthetase family member 2, mitochondrial [Tetranychus urticae]